MHKTETISKEVSLTRRELKNIRQEVMKLRANVRDDIGNIKLLVSGQSCNQGKNSVKNQTDNGFKMVPIGFISSCFKSKNGIPRQPSLCQSVKASLEVNKTFFTNPEHSLIGLSEFSYIWILFVFNENTETSVKAKVHPPRLNGTSVGVFSTRSPHRPCPIGLSLIKLDKIIGNTLFLSGVDMLDGTPVLDIKPYIATYDTPKLHEKVINITSEGLLMKDTEDPSTSKKNIADSTNFCSSLKSKPKEKISNSSNEDKDSEKSVENETSQINSPAESIKTLLEMPSKQLEVIFTERANKDIEKFHSPNHDDMCDYCLHFITDTSAAKQAIIDVLQNDPRSVYRRNKCSDKLYFFEIDKLHITCWFDDIIAEVLRVKLERNIKPQHHEIKK